MKMRKAMALALAGALVLTTVATGTTSEAAKKTKLKTKKVSIFVKGKKKISITGKKAKHKYTFTSKKKKIAKVSKTGVITGVKAGKTTITVKDTWKQKGKKKTKKLGTINVTVKKKTTPKPKVTPNVPQVTPQPPAPATQDPNGGGSQPPVVTPDNSGDPTPTPSGKPDDPTPTPSGKPDDPTPTPSGKPDDPTPTPDIKAPTAEMIIAGSNIRAEESTTAGVKVSAGTITDVTWKVESTTVATVQKDSADAKKAVITGVGEGETKVIAEVKVKVEDKDFNVKAEGMIHVAAKDALVINATIESAPTELEITRSAEMSVKVDVGEEEGVAPGAVETNKTATVQAEIDENDFTSIEWVSSDETKATVEADPEDQRNGIVTGVAAGEVEITVKIKKGDNVIKEETVKMEVRFNYKGTPIDIDLTKGEAVDGGTVTKNEDGSVLIMNEPGAVVCALPYALKKGEKVKVIMEGHFGEKSGGFRLWTAPDPSTVGGNKVQAGSTVNYELNNGKPDFNPGNDFSVTAELEASVECVNLVIRMPGWSGSVTTLTDLTFTRFAVEYI